AWLSTYARRRSSAAVAFSSMDTPKAWDPIAGLYPCGPGGRDGWVRLHTNFAHHRDVVLHLLGLPTGAGTPRESVRAALADWTAADFEAAASKAGLAVAALRGFDTWDSHPQQAAISKLPLVEVTRIGRAPPLVSPELQHSARPLDEIRVLDLTRILVGPIAGRTLAAYGADVMWSTRRICPTSKRSPTRPAASARPSPICAITTVAIVSRTPSPMRTCSCKAIGPAVSRHAVSAPRMPPPSPRNHLRVAFGLRAARTLGRSPRLRFAGAGGHRPQRRRGSHRWSRRAQAAAYAHPRHASGFLLAFGIETALLRQHAEGGSWHVQISLARTGRWLRELGRVSDGFAAARPDFPEHMEASDSGFGRLVALRHAARLSATRARYARPSVPPETTH